MGKIAALDLGDQWVGIAMSDALGMLARPLKTVSVTQLEKFLTELITQEKIEKIVVGHPKTMTGGSSQQTEKTILLYQHLQDLFPEQEFILWDERLSSKRAASIKPVKTKTDKLQSHAIAAAFILDTYLSYCAFHKNFVDNP